MEQSHWGALASWLPTGGLGAQPLQALGNCLSMEGHSPRASPWETGPSPGNTPYQDKRSQPCEVILTEPDAVCFLHKIVNALKAGPVSAVFQTQGSEFSVSGGKTAMVWTCLRSREGVLAGWVGVPVG